MRKTLILSALASVAIAGAIAVAPAVSQGRAPAAYITAALNDAGRPDADKARDAVREPAAMLEYAGIRPGSVIAEYIPGGGYFTRIFSKAVGANGKVFALITPPAPNRPAAVKAIAAEPAYSNVTVLEGNFTELKPPAQVDVVWTSQNYHDIPAATRAEMNKRALEMLKPGGIYIVLDHSAVVGTGDYAAASGLHRIDENHVKLEVLRAGFRYEGENNILRNPADPRTQRVFEQSLGRDTDQFVLKFRKPR